MAENLKALRRRLRTIRNTKQITRAMEMVSAAKLRRAQNALFASRPYASKLTEVLARLSTSSTVTHPLLTQRELRQRWLVVVTADRGLAGAFNAQIIKQAEQFLRANRENVALVCIGKKGFDYFRTKKWPIAWSVTDLNARISSQRANEIADRLMESFLNEQTDEILLLYNKFISTLVYRPVLEPILPIRAITGQETEARHKAREYLLEPSPDAVLQALLPRFARSKIFIMLAETFTAEHSARMVAMSGATRNCEELTDKLTLRLNKARQAAITKEIIEIVSGAEALKA